MLIPLALILKYWKKNWQKKTCSWILLDFIIEFIIGKFSIKLKLFNTTLELMKANVVCSTL